jgi:hypothetical protein
LTAQGFAVEQNVDLPTARNQFLATASVAIASNKSSGKAHMFA